MKVCKVYFFSKERLQVSLNNSVTKYVELIFSEVPRLMDQKFKFSRLAGKGTGSGLGFTSQGIRCS